MAATHTTSFPLVSIIVASYNCGAFIGETLESLRAQTYQNWECVLTDDGSTDDTREVVARYAQADDRIKYLHQPNRGVSAARNHSINHSRGDYMQFLDADDLLEAEKLSTHVRHLEGHPDVDIVYGGVRYFDSDSPEELRHSMWPHSKPWPTDAPGQGKPLVRALSMGNFIPINCPLLRRNVVEAVGLFDETLPPLEDWDYWLRCALAGYRFQYLEQAGTLGLVRSHQTSASKNRQRMVQANLRFQHKLLAMDASADAKLMRGAAANIEAWFGIDDVSDGYRWRGMSRLLRAGLMGGEARWRAKYLLCACVAPFTPSRHFTRVATASFTETLAALFRRPKPLPR